MNQRFVIIYLPLSFLLHFIIIVGSLTVMQEFSGSTSFLVFGPQSQQFTQAYFKSFPKPPEPAVQATQQAIAKTPEPPKIVEQPKLKEVTPKKEAEAIKSAKTIQETPEKQELPDLAQKKEIPKKTVSTSSETPMHFALQGTKDKRLLQYQKHIQREVSRLWQPPVGIPKGTECAVLFSVSKKGTIENFTITQASSIRLFNLSVIQIAGNFTFDKCLWGKKFTIHFRQ